MSRSRRRLTPSLRGVGEMRSNPAWVASRRQIGVFMGSVGAGRITVIRRFVAELPQAMFRLLHSHDSELTPTNLHWECLAEEAVDTYRKAVPPCPDESALLRALHYRQSHTYYRDDLQGHLRGSLRRLSCT